MYKLLSLALLLVITSGSLSAAISFRTRIEDGCGPNGCNFVQHTHYNGGSSCDVTCQGEGYSSCPTCTASVISSGSNNDISLHNYAKQQIIQGNLTGNQVSSDGLWKVKWEKKQNNKLSIVAWDLSGDEPPLWP